MSDEAEVDVTTRLSDCGTALGIFLHDPSPKGRSRAEAVLLEAGAEFIPYPSEALPTQIKGGVTVSDSTVSLWVGPLYIIAPLELARHELKTANKAALFVLPEPYEQACKTERKLLAAALPLDILEGEGAI